jgi:hypothetical protein
MKIELEACGVEEVIKLLKSLECLLLAHRAVYDRAWDSGLLPSLPQWLLQAEASAQVEMDAKYDELLRRLAGIHDQESANQALKFLAQWMPKGKPN